MIPIFLIPFVADATPPPAPEPFAAWPAPYIAEESHTEKKTYLRLNGGLTTTSSSDGPDEEIDFNEGYMLGVAIGRRTGQSDTGVGFMFELEGLWTDQDADDDGPIQAVSDLSIAALLLNGLVDYRVADAITIYGGAGIGAAWLNVGTEADSLNEFEEEDGPFLAWQARAGVGFHLGANTMLSVGYRFLNVDDAEIDDNIGDASFDLQTEQHILEVGLTFGI